MQKLDAKFWKTFANRNWEKSPLVVENVDSPLLQMDEAQVFKLLVLFADHCRQRNDSEGFKFFVDGEALYHEEVLDLLPLESDKSLHGYHKRMNEVFEDYCLVCDELLQVNAEKQQLLNEFTQGLYKQVGFPNRFAEMGLYLGNYRKTPFGVHVDGCGVFSFPVAGKKRFRIWKPEYVDNNPCLNRSFDYKKHLKASQLLMAGHGDMTYWPSSAWHIAEGDGSFSATWSLGVWIDKSHHTQLLEGLDELLAATLGPASKIGMIKFKNLHGEDGAVETLPAQYLKSLKRLAQLSEKDLTSHFEKIWMKHISMQGFKNAGVRASNDKLPNSFALRVQNSPVLWQKVGSKLNVAFAGQLIETRSSAKLLKILKAVNAGQAVTLKQFALAPSSLEAKALNQLNTFGAFTAVAARS